MRRACAALAARDQPSFVFDCLAIVRERAAGGLRPPLGHPGAGRQNEGGLADWCGGPGSPHCNHPPRPIVITALSPLHTRILTYSMYSSPRGPDGVPVCLSSAACILTERYSTPYNPQHTYIDRCTQHSLHQTTLCSHSSSAHTHLAARSDLNLAIHTAAI